jgi:hypothetical protein
MKLKHKISGTLLNFPDTEWALELTEPVEKWEDVTKYFEDRDVTTSDHIASGYRLRKVHGIGKPSAIPVECAFIVEHRK